MTPEQSHDIIEEARAAASLPLGTRIRCAGGFGVRWGEITGYEPADDTYTIAADGGGVHSGIDVGHIVEIA